MFSKNDEDQSDDEPPPPFKSVHEANARQRTQDIEDANDRAFEGLRLIFQPHNSDTGNDVFHDAYGGECGDRSSRSGCPPASIPPSSLGPIHSMLYGTNVGTSVAETEVSEIQYAQLSSCAFSAANQ